MIVEIVEIQLSFSTCGILKLAESNYEAKNRQFKIRWDLVHELYTGDSCDTGKRDSESARDSNEKLPSGGFVAIFYQSSLFRHGCVLVSKNDYNPSLCTKVC